MQLKLASNSDDIQFLYDTRCHPDVTKTLSGQPPKDFNQHLSYINKVQEKTRWIYVAIDLSGNRIGYSQIYDVKDNQLEVGFAIHPDFQGKGYGNQIVLETVKTAKHNYPNYKIILYVKKENHRAIHLYRKYGFVDAGETNDSIYMELK